MSATSDRILVTIGAYRLIGRLNEETCPRTCAAFRRMLPLKKTLMHARWSGEAAWVPIQAEVEPVPPEDATCHPFPGQLLFYPGGLSEPEILVPYGPCAFASKAGRLAGNPFLTLIEGGEALRVIGVELLRTGAQPITFERLD